MRPSEVLRFLVCLSAMIGASGVAYAQADYPSRLIRIVIPYPAGGTADPPARLIAEQMRKALGQPVIVDNRGGAGSMIGTRAVVGSPADGYMLLFHNSAIASQQALTKDTSFDVRRDLQPVSLAIQGVMGLYTTPSLPVTNVRELVAYAKANPGKLNYGSSGTGGLAHLMTESLKSAAGMDVTHVPYQGGAFSIRATIANEVQVLLYDVGLMAPYVQNNQVRLLGVATRERTDLAPGVPTLAESGVPGYVSPFFYGFFAPAGTPVAVVDKLSRTVVRILGEPDVAKQVLAMGYVAKGSSPEELGRMMTEEVDRFSRIASTVKLP